MSKCHYHTLRQFDVWLEETFERAKDINPKNNHEILKAKRKKQQRYVKTRQKNDKRKDIEHQNPTTVNNGRTILKKVTTNNGITKSTKSTKFQNNKRTQNTLIQSKQKNKCAGDYCLNNTNNNSNGPQTTSDNNKPDYVCIPYRVRRRR